MFTWGALVLHWAVFFFIDDRANGEAALAEEFSQHTIKESPLGLGRHAELSQQTIQDSALSPDRTGSGDPSQHTIEESNLSSHLTRGDNEVSDAICRNEETSERKLPPVGNRVESPESTKLSQHTIRESVSFSGGDLGKESFQEPSWVDASFEPNSGTGDLLHSAQDKTEPSRHSEKDSNRDSGLSQHSIPDDTVSPDKAVLSPYLNQLSQEFIANDLSQHTIQDSAVSSNDVAHAEVRQHSDATEMFDPTHATAAPFQFTTVSRPGDSRANFVPDSPPQFRPQFQQRTELGFSGLRGPVPEPAKASVAAAKERTDGKLETFSSTRDQGLQPEAAVPDMRRVERPSLEGAAADDIVARKLVPGVATGSNKHSHSAQVEVRVF